MSIDELGELHLRYVKGLDVPFSSVTRREDELIRAEFDGTPISAEEYHRAIEARLKKCACGGSYLFDAPSRCPDCSSPALEYADDPHIMYD